jgi:aspartyl-tRNA(Asn)/glutamyl-tRNA(Gln) amidotransferase subunit C
MSITREDVLRIAQLARLALEPEEVERLAMELSGILAHVHDLDEADTTGVSPFEIPAERGSSLRPDEPGADPLRVPLAQVAVGMRAGLFTVPRLYGPSGGEVEG